MKLKLQFMIAAFIVLVVYIPVAHGQASLTFSGGNGTPLSTTLQTTVTYTITNANCVNNSPLFIFQGVGNPIDNSVIVTGTITYSVNSGTSQPIFAEGSGLNAGAITTNDIFVFGPRSGAANGDTVVLSAGTVTVNGNTAAAPPANGSFTTFLTNNNGVICSSNGVAMTTAAPVSISGRVLTNSGRGLANAFVSLTDQNGNVKTALTNPFGYYHFADVAAGETYILTALAKRFTFSQPTQVLNITEDTEAVNFIANPSYKVEGKLVK